MLDAYESANRYYIILELCDGDLEKYILMNRTISEERAISIMSEIANGFTTLVREGVIHR
jgi:serine/threonine protein kinase